MRILRAVALLVFFFAPALLGQSLQVAQAQAQSHAAEYKLKPIAVQNANYPAEARERKLEGKVTASFLVSETGEVAYARAYTQEPTLKQAVEDAVSKWKFEPVTKDGSPIQVAGRATFSFTLNDQTQISNDVPAEIGSATDIPKKVRVSTGVMAGLLLRKVSPIYPEEAKRSGILGTVLLAATIGRDGSVASVQPISGPPDLIPAAMDAAKQWQYKPYMLMGTPVEVETQIQMDFTLRP